MSSPLNLNGPKLTIKTEDGKDKNIRDHMEIMRETEIKNDVSIHVPNKAVEKSNDEGYEAETSNTLSQTTAKRAIKKEDSSEVSMLLKKSSEEFKGTKSNVKVESNALKIKKEPKLKEKGGKKKVENKMKVCEYKSFIYRLGFHYDIVGLILIYCHLFFLFRFWLIWVNSSNH